MILYDPDAVESWVSVYLEVIRGGPEDFGVRAHEVSDKVAR
jgi:hypothetical protein